jgi:hypothetical protein
MAIWAVFLLWVVASIRRGNIGKIRHLPLSLIVFIVFALLSVIAADRSVGSLKDLVQLFDYFVLLFIVVVNNIETKKQVVTLIDILCAVTAITICYAAYQYVLFSDMTYMVRATFENRNVFNAYLSITMPLLFCMFTIRRSRIASILYGAVLAGGIVVVTSIPAFFMLAVTLSVLSFIITRRARSIAVVLAIFLITAVAPVGVGIDEFGRLRHLLGDAESKEGYHAKLEKAARMTCHERLAKHEGEKYAIYLYSDVVPLREISAAYVDDQVGARIKYVMFGEGGHVNQRFIEWYAAFNILGEKPLLGVGTGNYYSQIGFYYNLLPKINTIEPESQNGYLMTLFTMGLCGLGALVWIMTHFFRMGAGAFKTAGESFEKRLALGLLGSLGTGILINNFYPLIYKTTAIPFVFVLALIYIVSSKPAGSPDDHHG